MTIGADEKLIARVTREALESLTPREAIVIMRSYGICGMNKVTDQQIAIFYGTETHRIQQIRAKALAKLRHSSRAHLLKPKVTP